MPSQNPYGTFGQFPNSFWMNPNGAPNLGNNPNWWTQFGSWQYGTNPGSEGGGGESNLNWLSTVPRLSSSGPITGSAGGQVLIDGRYIQTGGQNPEGIQLIDPNAVIYDPEFGWITDISNIDQDFTFLDALPYIMGALGGGLSAYHAGATGLGAAGGGGDYFFGDYLSQLGASETLPTLSGLGGGGGGLGGLLSTLGRFGSGGLSLLSRLLGGGGGGGNGGGGGGDFLSTLLDLLGLGGGAAMSNRNNQRYREDIERLLSIGTAGITNDDRKPLQDLFRGIYDGSISGDEIFNRIPGLRALSERGADDISRLWSAKGESANMPNNPHAMREWVDFNNELTSRAWDSEMNRLGRASGYFFDPSNMAGRGLQGLGDLYRNREDQNSDLLRGLRGLLGGGGGGGAGGLLGLLSNFLSSGGTNFGEFLQDLSPTDLDSLGLSEEDIQEYLDLFGNEPGPWDLDDGGWFDDLIGEF